MEPDERSGYEAAISQGDVNRNGSTTEQGAPAASDRNSLTVGADGPIVLHDSHLIETLAHFNRESVPERRPHAKGSGAFGEFETTGDVSQYTKAKLFQPGTRVRMLARFSTVAGELGSPDTWRDVRGFSLKFYTAEGNYDMVGNNTPIFFVRDPLKFPHFIHSQKRLPDTGLRDHDMQWDFWTLTPESAHQVTYLMGDRGIPRSWRFMNGFSSHTYQWVNEAGERFWVKYHFQTQQGVQNLSDDVANQIIGLDSDFHRRDLFEAIERGEFPQWKLFVQVMPYADAKTYRFNPFDLTKVWPHADYPLIEVGTMTLNENPTNHFAQIEQAAFSPSNLVPGIGISPDKMLVARTFAYADAHRARIGANFNDLPVNQPLTQRHDYMIDGAMRVHDRGDAPTYAPNSYGYSYADEEGTSPDGWESDGELVRSAYTLRADDDDWSQARALINDVMDDAARERFVTNVANHLLDGVTDTVLQRAYWYWKSVDDAIGQRIQAAVEKGKQGKPSAAELAESNAIPEEGGRGGDY